MEIDEAQIESLARALVGAASPGAHKTLSKRWEMMFGPTKELYRKRARWLIEDGWTHHDYKDFIKVDDLYATESPE